MGEGKQTEQGTIRRKWTDAASLVMLSIALVAFVSATILPALIKGPVPDRNGMMLTAIFLMLIAIYWRMD